MSVATKIDRRCHALCWRVGSWLLPEWCGSLPHPSPDIILPPGGSVVSPPTSAAGAYYTPRTVDVATGSGEFLRGANPPYATRLPLGWQCPACHAAMAPWQSVCTGQHVQAVSATG